MKTLLLSLVALSLLATSCTSGSQNPDARKNFVDVCITSAQRDFGKDPKMDAHIKTYCECSADRIIESFTESELRTLDTNPNDAALNAKRDMAIAPCKDAFIKAAAMTPAP